MSTKLAKEARSLDTAEYALKEVIAASKSLDTLEQDMRRHKRGSDPYLETLAEIAVAAEVLNAKLTSLVAAIDAAEDGLPDET
jgi:hypothetical protein